MKNQSGALLYFSAYPLRLANAEAQKSKEPKKNLAIARSGVQAITKKKNMADNPGNWDEGWFCNYE